MPTTDKVTVVAGTATRRTITTLTTNGLYPVANQAAMLALQVPVGAPELNQLWVHAIAFQAVQGFASVASAYVNQVYGFAGLPFDAAGTETNCAEVHIPWTWSTFNLDAYTVNVAGGAGNVVMQAGYGAYGDGDTVNAGTTSGSLTTFAAPAANTLSVQRLLTGVPAAANAKAQHLMVQRVGGDAGDTYASDYWLRGVLLTKAS